MTLGNENNIKTFVKNIKTLLFYMDFMCRKNVKWELNVLVNLITT